MEKTIAFLCDPIFCPLSNVNLAIFKARVKPLTLDTPPEDCENWFYTTVKNVLEIKEQQLYQLKKLIFSIDSVKFFTSEKNIVAQNQIVSKGKNYFKIYTKFKVYSD